MRIRHATVGLIALVGAANALALGLLVHYLLRGGRAGGADLLVSAITIWLTNVLVFALWYLSFTNATALSPPTPSPLSAWAKLLMMVQASVSLLTLVLVAGHAVNVLD